MIIYFEYYEGDIYLSLDYPRGDCKTEIFDHPSDLIEHVLHNRLNGERFYGLDEVLKWRNE